MAAKNKKVIIAVGTQLDAKSAKRTQEQFAQLLKGLKESTFRVDFDTTQAARDISNLDKAFGSLLSKDVKGFNQQLKNAGKIEWSGLERTLTTILNDLNQLSQVLTRVNQKGLLEINVDGFKTFQSILTGAVAGTDEFNKKLKSLVSGNGIVDTLEHISNLLTQIADSLHIKDLEPIDVLDEKLAKAREEAQALQDNLSNIGASARGKSAKRNFGGDLTKQFESFEEYFNNATDRVKKAAQSVLSGSFGENTAGLRKFVNTLAQARTLSKEELDKLYIELGEGENKTRHKLEEFWQSIEKNYANQVKIGSDTYKGIISSEALLQLDDANQKVAELENKLAEARVYFGKAFTVDIDQATIDKLTNSLGNLNASIGEGATLGIKEEQIDRITKAFESLREIVQSIYDLLSRPGAIQVATQGMESLNEQAQKAGESITQKFTEGMKEGTSEAVEAAENIAEAAVDALEESSSKVKEFYEEFGTPSQALDSSAFGKDLVSQLDIADDKLSDSTLSEKQFQSSIVGTTEELERQKEVLENISRLVYHAGDLSHIDTSSKTYVIDALEESEQKFELAVIETNKELERQAQIYRDAFDKDIGKDKDKFDFNIPFDNIEKVTGEVVDNINDKLGLTFQVQDFTELFTSLKDITEQIDAKTQAFRNEGEVVDSVIPNEVANLQSLSKELEKIINLLNTKTDSFSSVFEALNRATLPDFSNSGLNDLNKLINNLANNKNDRIYKLLETLHDIHKVLNKNVKDNSLGKALTELGKQQEGLKALVTLLKNYDKAVATVEKATQSAADKAQKEAEQAAEKAKKLEEQAKKAEAKQAESKLNDEIKKAETIIDRLEKQIREMGRNGQGDLVGNEYDAFIGKVDEFKSSFREDFKSNLEGTKTTLHNLVVEAEDLAAAGKKASKELKGIASKEAVNSQLQKMQTFLSTNKKLSQDTIDQVNRLMASLHPDKTTSSELKKVRDEFDAIYQSAKRSNEIGNTWGQGLKKRLTSLTQYLASFVSFYEVVGIFRDAINTVRELDTALTEMRKVSDESLSSLQQYQSLSFDIADEIGSTSLALQNSTADWMRLGESLEDAAESAKTATVLLNVSEFENIEDATSALVSASQAYKELDKMDIVDVLNNIGNNFSVSTDQLAQGLQNAAAVLKTQGNDLNEAVALLTAGNAITQDMSKTSAGIRTIALRIAGTEEAKDELKEMGEDVDDFIVGTSAKMQSLIKDYTAVASNAYQGVDILDANGNLRNTYDILLDISKIYQEILDTDKKAGTNRGQALVEAIAGEIFAWMIWKHIIKNTFNCIDCLKLHATIIGKLYYDGLTSWRYNNG